MQALQPSHFKLLNFVRRQTILGVPEITTCRPNIDLLQLAHATWPEVADLRRRFDHVSNMSTGTFDANKAQNLPEIEKQMAVRCVEHAQTYWNLLEKIKPSTLRLTKIDDEMYEDFQASFPEFAESGDPKSVLKIDEEAMKSPAGKEKWRLFINKYENKVADFNFGTLIRTDASDEYTQFNTTFVTRLQFYVYEIARCRRGLNDWVYEKAQKEAAKEKAKKAESAAK